MKLSKISQKVLFQTIFYYVIIIVGMGVGLFLDNLAFATNQLSFFARLYVVLGFFAFLLTVGIPALYMEKLALKFGKEKEAVQKQKSAKDIILFTKGHLIIGTFEFMLHFSAYLMGIFFMAKGPGISSTQIYQAFSAGFAISLTFAVSVTVVMRRNLQMLARETGFLQNVSKPKESYLGKLVSINAVMLLIVTFVVGFISYSNGFNIMRNTQVEEMLHTSQILTQFFETLDLENKTGIARSQSYLTRFFQDKRKKYLLVNENGVILASNDSRKTIDPIPIQRLKKWSLANYKNSLLYFFPDYAKGKMYAWREVDGGSVYFVSVLNEDLISSALIKAIVEHGWVILLIVLFGVFAIAFVTLDMVTPIRHLVNEAQLISKGDFRKSIQTETWDELLYLSKALESVRLNFAKMAHQIKVSAKRIEQASEFIAEATNEEASGVVEYASSINEVLATLEELSATGKKVAENAAGVSELSEKNLQRVEEGHELIDQYKTQSEEIEQRFRKSLDKLEQLHKRINDISQIVELIETISGETKILSINASIESARGGENSRGFGVVAAEIRKLTDRVVNSTSTIRNSIQEIIALADETLRLYQKSWSDFQQQGRAIESLHKSFDEILHYSEQTAESAQAISGSIDQQSAATMQVNHTMQEISHLIKESSQMIQRTRNEVEDFNQMADKFLDLLSLFHFEQKEEPQPNSQKAEIRNPILEEEVPVL